MKKKPEECTFAGQSIMVDGCLVPCPDDVSFALMIRAALEGGANEDEVFGESKELREMYRRIGPTLARPNEQPTEAAPKSKTKRKATESFGVVFTWKPGDQTRISLADCMSKWASLQASLASSNDPYFREIGARGLRQMSELAAAKTSSTLVNQKSASSKRSKDPMTEDIRKIMSRSKCSGDSFKEFFAAWEREPISGLSLKLRRESPKLETCKYEVARLNCKPKQAKEYAYKSLRDGLWVEV